MALTLAFLGGVAVALIAWRYHDLHRRIAALERDADHRRHTHSITAGLEDSIADIIAWKIHLDTEQARADTVLHKLQTLRQGPYSYPAEGKFTDQRRPKS